MLSNRYSFADRVASDNCAARLSGDAAAIYAATIDEVKPDSDLRTVIRAKARSLVMSGKISRGDARSAAEHAGACLKLAK